MSVSVCVIPFTLRNTNLFHKDKVGLGEEDGNTRGLHLWSGCCGEGSNSDKTEKNSAGFFCRVQLLVTEIWPADWPNV